MPPKTRLDPVIRIEKKKEEQRLLEMAEARQQATRAEALLAEARALAEQDRRRSASAFDWQMAEVAHARALADLRGAEVAAAQAQVSSNQSRDRYAAARAKVEALERVAAARAAEITRDEERKANKELDELALIAFVRKTAAA
jgi:flagellar biosynthesis chaperone FliJ